MTYDFLKELGIEEVNSGAAAGAFLDKPTGGKLVSETPIDGKPIATVLKASAQDYETVLSKATEAFQDVSDGAGPAARRAGARDRRRAAQVQGAARQAGDPRDGQDPPRGVGRGAGDDRHGRLRGSARAGCSTA